MNKLKNALVGALLVAAIVAPAGCREAEVPTVADVLGTWEIKSWTLNQSDAHFNGCDMKGTLEFIAHSYEGRPYYSVRFTFMRDGLAQVLTGYAQLDELPVIRFETGFGSGFPDHLGFRGIVENGGMIGRGGFFWDIRSYEHWEWEAVKR